MRFLAFALTLTFFILFFVKNSFAEIATVRDWIGLFDTTETGNGKSNTVNGTSWAYTYNCTQATPGPTAVPKLSDSTGCTIVSIPVPSTGDYEYRLYAYDGETSNDLIAKSKSFSAQPTSNPNPRGGVPCPLQSSYPRVRNGLMTAPQISNNYGNYTNSTAPCIIDNQAIFAPYKIPTYDDLKSLYFTQSKAAKTTLSGPGNQGRLRSALNGNDIVLVSGDLNLIGNLGGSNKTAVIFVDGNLTFTNTNFTFGDANSGIVFVVKGNINIDPSITEIDAVLIAGGQIYTAAAEGLTCTTSSSAGIPQLLIKGSFISLPGGNIVLCRKLGNTDNATPAEKIVQQGKYLVILRDLFSSNFEKWSELTN